MKKLYLIFLVLTAQFSISQTQNWEWVTGIQASFGNPHNVLSLDGQGNLYTFASFMSDVITDDYQFPITNPNNGRDSYFVKYNADGEWQWARHITSTGLNTLWDLEADAAGNVYIIGSYSNNLGIGGQQLNGLGTYVAKFDTDGNMLWIKTGSFTNPGCLALDNSGNIYFQASAMSFVFDGTTFTNVNTNSNNQYLAKLDTNGNIIWKKTYYGPDDYTKHNTAEQMRVDSEGNLFLTGRTNQSTITFDNTILNNNYSGAFFLAKFNVQGEIQWAISTGNNACSNSASDIVTDTDNNIYLFGNYCSTVDFGSTTLTVQPSGSRYFIAKYSPSGENLWVKTSSPGLFSNIQSGDIDANGNLVVGGSFFGTVDFGNDVTFTSSESEGAQFVVMYNANGEAQWGTTTGPININNGMDVKAFGNNTIYTGAHMQVPSLTYGDITYVRQGDNFYNITLGKLVYTPLAGISKKEFNKIEAYPNPVTDMLTIDTDENVMSIKIADCNGRTVSEQFNTKEIRFDNIQAGIYFLTIETPSGKEIKKIIKK